MVDINLSNYNRVLRNGDVVIYSSGPDKNYGIVRKNAKYNGGWEVNGRSIINVLESFDSVVTITW